MRILGLDPGSRFTGYAILAVENARIETIDAGRIALPVERPLGERLLVLSEALEELIARHRPEVAAIEEPFHGVNSRSLIVLAEARGAILLVLARSGIAVAEYSTTAVKSAIAGNGHADKEGVARGVRLHLGLRAGLPADATDALAVGLCHAHRRRFEERTAIR